MLIVKCRRQTRGSEDGIHTENCGIPAGIAEGVGTAHLQGVVDTHVCTHSRAHTLHAMGWSHQHAFTCNIHAHITCSHTTYSPMRHALLFMCTCSKCMLAHSHYTHAHTHTCTHMAVWTHTDPQSRTCVLPKMLRYIHAQTENAGRTTEKQAQTPPHP